VPIKENARLIKRIRQIRGQIEAMERRIEYGNCTDILQFIAATRGPLNALMAEVIAYHIHANVVESRLSDSTAQAGEQLIGVVRSCLR
jgi:FrmR/RcnR family transcriptional regulator, repressor of frmRAB operon